MRLLLLVVFAGCQAEDPGHRPGATAPTLPPTSSPPGTLGEGTSDGGTQLGGEGTEDVGPKEVVVTLPAPGAVDVPTDSWVFALSRVSANEFDLELSDGGAALAGDLRDLVFPSSPRIVYFAPDAPLAPLTAHTVDILGAADVVVPATTDFTTGEAVTPAPGTVDLVSVSFGSDRTTSSGVDVRDLTIELDVAVDSPSVVRIHAQADDGTCGELDVHELNYNSTGGTSSTTGPYADPLGWITLHTAFFVDPSDTRIAGTIPDSLNTGPDTDCICAVVMAGNGAEGPVSATVCGP